MQKDILEGVKRIMKEGIKVCYAKLANQFNCDYRTIKKAHRIQSCEIATKERKKQKSILDEYKIVIDKKMEYNKDKEANNGDCTKLLQKQNILNLLYFFILRKIFYSKGFTAPN